MSLRFFPLVRGRLVRDPRGWNVISALSAYSAVYVLRRCGSSRWCADVSSAEARSAFVMECLLGALRVLSGLRFSHCGSSRWCADVSSAEARSAFVMECHLGALRVLSGLRFSHCGSSRWCAAVSSAEARSAFVMECHLGALRVLSGLRFTPLRFLPLVRGRLVRRSEIRVRDGMSARRSPRAQRFTF